MSFSLSALSGRDRSGPGWGSSAHPAGCRNVTDDDAPLGQRIPAEFYISVRLAHHRERGRIQAHGLFDDHFGIGQVRQVFHARIAPAEHARQFVVQPGFRIRVL